MIPLLLELAAAQAEQQAMAEAAKTLSSIKIKMTGMERMRKAFATKDARLNSVKAFVPWYGSDQLVQFLAQKIPNTPKYQGLRRSLVVGKVEGSDKTEAGYALFVNRASPYARQNNSEQKAIYITRNSKNLKKREQWVTILEKFSPWTFQTLPFTPDPTIAKMRLESVRGPALLKIGMQNIRDRTKWAPALAKLGMRSNSKNPETKVNPTLTDAEQAGFDLEFGAEKSQPMPAWSIGVKRIARVLIPLMGRDPNLIPRMLLDGDSDKYKQMPPPTRYILPSLQARQLVDFQKRIIK